MTRPLFVAASCVATLLLASGFAASPQVGSPDVNLSPKRIVVADGERGSQEVLVFNRGTASATYSVTLVDRRMTSDGLLSPVEDPADPSMSAAAMIRYSPRRVTLEPGQSQVVRLQVRRPADLPDGEYRTHLTVSALPPSESGFTIDEAANAGPSDSIQVRITPVYGVSIPVIIRQGALAAAVGITRVSWREGQSALQVDFTRSGSRSAYGDVIVRAGGANGTVVGELRGVGIYPEVNDRSVVIPIDPDAARLGSGEVIHVSLIDRDADVGSILATATSTL